MKKFNLFLLISAMLMMSSCAISTSVPKMEKNYNARMTSSEELSAKTNIKIFLNEKDVPYDYTVLAFVKYKPLTVPIFMTERGKMTRKFYKKSVMKAAQLGGDAIIIQGMGLCKVIAAVGDNAGGNRMNSVLKVFEDGSIKTLSQKEKNVYSNALKEEIENDLKDCFTRDDLVNVSKKIDALEKFYVEEGQKTKVIDGYRQDYNEVEAKIQKKENRSAKFEELKSKINSAADKLRKE